MSLSALLARGVVVVVCLLATVAVAGAATGAGSDAVARANVAYVVDGDTIALQGGRHVRLLQIDAPEVGTGECYSRASARELRRLLPGGSAVRLLADGRLDGVDSYGRLLRYAYRGSTNVNVAMVRRGAATIWFYGGVRGRFAGALLSAGRQARAERRGMWGACRTPWNPHAPARPRHKGPAQSSGSSGRGRGCDPS